MRLKDERCRGSDAKELVPEQVFPGVYLIRDTCNVYVIVADPPSGETTGECTAVAVDFGSGLVLDCLAGLGVTRITDVLMTHHHRDQGQGLPRAVEHGARIHVPPVEMDLFADVDEMWRTRPLDVDYNVRQDRFSLVDSVAITSTVPEYRRAIFGGVTLRTIPTPGHTLGSVSYRLDRDGHRLVFSGDLVYAPGKVWSLAATQWSYGHHEGPAMSVLSCHLLLDEAPDLLLPSHGRPMTDPVTALSTLATRLNALVNTRRHVPWDLQDRLRHPYVPVTKHLLRNDSSESVSYVLLSETGEALMVDFGYDMVTGLPQGSDRASRRPWLASLAALKADFGVQRIAVAVPTHYHDDHLAGMPLLREVEGAEIWAPEHVARVMAEPWATDLPCQWFDPISADRVLPLGKSFQWNEYSVTVHDQPGHTRYAAAYEVTVDGLTVLFTGDQQENRGRRGVYREIPNYQYRNRFRPEDYLASAELYQRIRPDLLLGGHWEPRWVDDDYLSYLSEVAQELIHLHEQLLPAEADLGADGVVARIRPYRCRTTPGAAVDFLVEVRNPYPYPAAAVLAPVVPAGWDLVAPRSVMLEPAGDTSVGFTVRAGASPIRRARVVVDVTIGSLMLGQHAEALIDVVADVVAIPAAVDAPGWPA